MTIQEAIQSGKPFKRPYMNEYVHRPLITLEIPDILATDWEVEREPITLWVAIYPDGTVGKASYEVTDAVVLKHGKSVLRKFVEAIDE